MKPIIRVENLGKQYGIGRRESPYATLRESLVGAARAPFDRLRRRLRREVSRDAASERFWALRDVNFEVVPGEVVGVIGRNGAGKSTLLKVLSRITEPTRGLVELYGRVGSLLEVGTGFHTELSGRENIYLNGSILGMSRRVIRRKFDEIVSFSEVGQFIDTPVKHYSSGMQMRLAFAVAAHLEPDVLVLDEVLAVGDAHFQRRCVGKMNEVAGQGRTVLLVSHQLDMISKLCGRAILLRSGRLAFDGQVKDALEIYTRCGQKDSNDERTSPREGTGEVRFGDVRASRDMYEPEEEKKFYFEVRPSTRSHDRYYISALVLNSRSETVFQIDSRVFGLWYDPRGTQRGTIVIRHPWMQPGDYTVDMYLCNTDRVVDKFDSAIAFSISPTLPYPCVTHPGATSHGPVLGDYSFSEVTGNLIGEGL